MKALKLPTQPFIINSDPEIDPRPLILLNLQLTEIEKHFCVLKKFPHPKGVQLKALKFRNIQLVLSIML